MSKHTIQGALHFAKEAASPMANEANWHHLRAYLTALIEQERQKAARECIRLLYGPEILRAGTFEATVRAHFKLEKP